MLHDNSQEGRMQVGQFFWNQELFVKLGADKSVAQWAASQNSNSAIGGLLPKRSKHGFTLRFWYGESSVIKDQCGGRGGTESKFLLEGSYSAIEQDTTPISTQKTRMIGLRWIAWTIKSWGVGCTECHFCWSGQKK